MGWGYGYLKARRLTSAPPSCRCQVCVASGKAIRDAGWQRCRRCRHAMITAELAPGQLACPLCHAALAGRAAGGSSGAGAARGRAARGSSLRREPSGPRTPGAAAAAEAGGAAATAGAVGGPQPLAAR
jgi:hypothetical protein